AAIAQAENPLDTLSRSKDPTPQGLVELGDLYVEAMRLAEAKKMYRRALAKTADYAEAKFGLARIQIARGNFKKAKSACRHISFANKKKTAGEICSGWFWLSNDRSARAVEEFQKAISKGDIARGKTGMGEVLRRQSDHARAIAAYNDALAAGAGYLAYIGLGLTREQSGDKQGATEALEKAVSLQPASCLAHFHYGRLLGQGSNAIREIETAIAMRKDWPDAYQVLGDIHYSAGDYAHASQAYEQAAKGESGIAYLGLGKALYKTKKLEAARQALIKAGELNPDLIDVYKLLADIQYALGDYDGTTDALNKMRNLSPEDVGVYLHCGDLYYKMGRFTTARSFLEQAVSMKPTLSYAHYLLGQIACKRRLYAPGQQHYQQALTGDMDGVSKSDIEKQNATCVPTQ
ncbi:MAG: tetratricopeptide repeat protein, partial [Proteobacteria bacterium]|nr:tetratricopeptide repeat protein [Pseudomonadota bacterium]